MTTAPAPSDKAVASELPEWALTHAVAAVRIGQTAPVIEAALIGKGLPASAASSVVDAAFQHRLEVDRRTRRRNERWKAIQEVASIIAGIVCTMAAGINGGLKEAMICGAGLVPALALIWFSEELGGFVSRSGFIGINRPTAGCLVAFAGWLFLAVTLLMSIAR